MRWRAEAAPGAAVPPLGPDGFPRGERRDRMADRPTVTVDRLRLPDGSEAALKRYFFPTPGRRLRGALRHTLLGTPKAVREGRNLLRLRSVGVAVVEPLAWAVARTAFGLVKDGWLLTRFVPEAETLQARLLAGAAPHREGFHRIGESVGRIHAAGCWYRNLCARNLLLDSSGAHHWLDPSKSLWQSGEVHAAHALQDLLVLLGPWEARLPADAFAALMEGHGRWPGARNTRDLLALAPAPARSSLQAAVLRERRRLERAAVPGGS